MRLPSLNLYVRLFVCVCVHACVRVCVCVSLSTLPHKVMRFMGDPKLSGTKQMVLGNYIVQKVSSSDLTYNLTDLPFHSIPPSLPPSLPQAILSKPLQEELYAQLCNQTWCNKDEETLRRGWILMALTSGSIPPSDRLEKYLIK